MSKLSKLVFAILFSSILILNTGLVLGIEPDEASITISWDSSQLNRGEVGIARITFISNFSQPIQIYYIGINFDWMESDTFQGQDLSNNPVTIPSYGSHSFDLMLFQIPTSITVGSHHYFVGIDGTYGDSQGGLPVGFSWDSPILTLEIQDSTQKSYPELYDEVSNKLNDASNSNYDSPEANDLLLEAIAAYDTAINYASNNQFSEAITYLQIASSYIDQANQEEQAFDSQNQDQNQILLFAVIGIIAVAAIIIIFFLLIKRKHKKPKSEPETTDNPTESEPDDTNPEDINEKEE